MKVVLPLFGSVFFVGRRVVWMPIFAVGIGLRPTFGFLHWILSSPPKPIRTTSLSIAQRLEVEIVSWYPKDSPEKKWLKTKHQHQKYGFHTTRGRTTPKFDGFNRENDETMVIRGSFASVLESPLRADLQVLHDTFLAAGGLKHHEGVS